MRDNVGIVVEGGGFRAIYTAAVLEVLHREQLQFPYIIGVSAGAAYGVSYVSNQPGRNLETNQYINDKRYCGAKHLLKSGNYFNWDFIYKEIPQTLSPLDYNTLKNSSSRFFTVLTHCKTGKATFFNLNEDSPERLGDLLAASSSLPFISKMKYIDGEPYLDGGLINAIPIDHAFREGNQRLIVILTRPPEYRKENSKLNAFFKLCYRKYPALVKVMLERATNYNKRLEEIESLRAEGKVFVIRPKQSIPIDRLENNPETLEKVYHETMKDIEKLLPALKEWLG